MSSNSTNPLASRIAGQIAASAAFGMYTDADGLQRTASCITFHQFMDACLYDRDYGYYRSGQERVGKKGDFYTSSAIGRVLAEAVADYALTYASSSAQPLRFVEWGAGTGRLSAQIAAAGNKRQGGQDGAYPFEHWLIEDHPLHRAAILNAFEIAEVKEKPLLLSSDEAWQALRMAGPSVVLANELLDAWPVHRIRRVNGKLTELGVAGGLESGFHYAQMPISDARLEYWLVRNGIQLLEGQCTEICLEAAEWLKRLAATMGKGRLMLIDYGHEAEEYAAPHRMEGTLMCYWKHQASDTPFQRIGGQDITAHVSFTLVRQAAEDCGWKTVYYATQKQFLIDHGIFELLKDHQDPDPFSEAARMNRAVRQLLLSDQMSEAFKVMVLEK